MLLEEPVLEKTLRPGAVRNGREVQTHLLRNLDPVGAGEQIADRIVSLVFSGFEVDFYCAFM